MRYKEFNSRNILRYAFHIYRKNNLVLTQQSFSERILGMHSSYYSSMIARDRCASRRVIESLELATKTIMATFLGNRHFGKPYAANLNQAYSELQQLVERISQETMFPKQVYIVDDQTDGPTAP